MLGHDDLVIIGRVLGALVIGASIGFERTFHGRPAGFRTHALVCVASALLMIVTVYQSQWMTFVEHDAIRTDPTRMAQGIMTGIGFLGAGVIFKEGLTVRGLTTAASIWITSAIGILVGIGFWFAAIVGATATLIILALFRYIEARLPSEFYAHHMLRFARDSRDDRGRSAQADREAWLHDRELVVAPERRWPAVRIPHDHQEPQPQERGSSCLSPARTA